MRLIDLIDGVEDGVLTMEISSEDIDETKVGLIRRVDGAHLVRKIQEADGTYSELWIYSTEDDDPLKIRREIVAGTDINVEEGESEDGKQRYKIWSPGNCEFLELIGLPS